MATISSFNTAMIKSYSESGLKSTLWNKPVKKSKFEFIENLKQEYLNS